MVTHDKAFGIWLSYRIGSRISPVTKYGGQSESLHDDDHQLVWQFRSADSKGRNGNFIIDKNESPQDFQLNSCRKDIDHA